MNSQGPDHQLDEGAELHAPNARCVAGALISAGKVLLVKRAPQSRFYPDVWDLPGGHIEEGESVEDALRREVIEELQVDIESFRLLGTVYDPVEPAEIMIFAVSAWKGEPVNASPGEHSELCWFTADRLPGSAALDGYRSLSGWPELMFTVEDTPTPVPPTKG